MSIAVIAPALIDSASERPPELSSIRVFPSADVLPANLLRFHLRFSRAVDVFDVTKHLRLVEVTGGINQIVTHPFLDLSDGLWSADGLTLTVMLHPGRIKSGLAAHEALGAAIYSERGYELQIRHGFEASEFVEPTNEWFTLKQFSVRDALNSFLDIKSFAIRSPRAGTSAPIEIESAHIADRLAIENFVAVTDAFGAAVLVDIDADQPETTILIKPKTAWRAGAYTIHFASEFEDVSGNRFGVPFERDGTYPLTNETTTLTVPISSD